MKVSGPQKTHNDTNTKNKWVCSTTGFSIGMHILSFAHDAVFISIIIWSSVSMVILLNRHHQRLQHIQSTNQKLRVHAETRAAHTILMLVVTFVTCYFLDCICTFCNMSFLDSQLWLRRVKQILDVSFPIFSPLLLIFRDPNDPCSLLFSCWKWQSKWQIFLITFLTAINILFSWNKFNMFLGQLLQKAIVLFVIWC